MNYKIVVASLILAGCMTQRSMADLSLVQTQGVGTRAYGMANNFVALSSDQSAMFWNPAGLAFVPAREFQLSFDGLYQRDVSTFAGNQGNSSLGRPRLSNIGYMHSFPTVRGGFTIAGTFESPYIFDDVRAFTGTSLDTSFSSPTPVSIEDNLRNSGELNFWSGGFGLQIAPGIGIGLSAALVNGGQQTKKTAVRRTLISGQYQILDPYYDDYDITLNRSYIGYDIRIGFMYSFLEKFHLGARFTIPQTIWFTENMSVTYPHSNYPDSSGQSTGKIFSSYSGALGFAATLRYLTVSTEVRARAPYDFVNPTDIIPQQSLAGKPRIGVGIGLEAPLVVSAVLVRAGYSWDQYDSHPFAEKVDNGKPMNWESGGLEPDGDKHLVTVGLGFILKSIGLDLAYGYNFWNLTTHGSVIDVLHETHSQQRFTASLSFRF